VVVPRWRAARRARVGLTRSSGAVGAG
jgi:hypothetical protein